MTAPARESRLTWALSGEADDEFFTIDGGTLKFKTSPNFESAIRTRAANNVYNVT